MAEPTPVSYTHLDVYKRQLVESVPGEGDSGMANELEAPLRARLGEKSARGAPGNPRVLLACLPSLSRLRGQTMTRWYAPSNCPQVGR